MAHIDNAGSNRVLEKLGFSFIDTFVHNGIEHKWYKMNISDFEKLRSNNEQELKLKSDNGRLKKVRFFNISSIPIKQ